jgi:hypothetical protein
VEGADGETGRLKPAVRSPDADSEVFVPWAPSVLSKEEPAGSLTGERKLAVRPAVRVGKFSYEFRSEEAALTLPTAGAPVNILEVATGEKGWQVASDAAALVEPLERDSGSAARLVLMPKGEISLTLKPGARDPFSEDTAFFVEVANGYVPGPGLLEGRHRVTIRPSQGVVRQVRMKVPAGLTVSAVEDEKVADWRFSADSRELVVELLEAQSQAFSFAVTTQRSLSALPLDLELQPLRVLDSKRELGTLGIAFRGQAQADTIAVDGLLEVNLADFDRALLPAKAGLVHRAYRYGAEEAVARVKVVPVAPEVRVESEELLSVGSERTLLKSRLLVEISRAGIFRFDFTVPEGFEVESLAGAAMSHWTESGEDDDRTVTVHLQEQTLGRQVFEMVLVKAGPIETGGEWAVPRVSVAEASRQTGQLIVNSEQGLRLRTLERQNVSEVDPRTLGRVGKNAALAFRLLQQDWKLTLGIEKLDAWVTGQILHELTLREGQTRNVVVADFKIENASVESLPVRLPGLDAEQAKTLRASGNAVSGIAPGDEEGIWKVAFKRRVIGEVPVRIEWERTGESKLLQQSKNM